MSSLNSGLVVEGVLASRVAADGGSLEFSDARQVVAESCGKLPLDGKKILLIVPDSTRTAPVGDVFKSIHAEISGKVAALDVMIALGTHPPMSDEAICQRLEISESQWKSDYGNVQFFNHAWDDPNALVELGRISPQEIEKLSGINVPILPDEYYTVRNSIKILGQDQYQVDWKLLRAIQTKDSEGFLRVEPFEGGSVIMYQNLVTPGSSMAGLLRGKAIEQMRETVTAISAHVEKKKATAPAELQKNVQSFRGMISGTSKTP